MSLGITVYDGANCIGGNKIYLDNGKDGIFLDFGKNFGKYARFYEEFLKNRTTRGIHDLLQLDLIPRLNIYRPDLIPSDIDVTPYPKLPVAAVFLTHAHLDHCGNVGVLDTSIPVIATPMSFAILKGYQDVGKSGTEADVTYTSLRMPKPEDSQYLDVDRKAYIGRDLVCTIKPLDSFQEFLSQKPGGQSERSKKLVPGTCRTLDEVSFPFQVAAFEVDHSIYGSCGYIVEADTTVAYTGDFRLHGKREWMTREFVQRAKDASVLVMEGTRVADAGPEDGSRISEDSVCETCQASVEETDDLVIADFSARNFERLEAFREIARKTGRDLVVTAKDLYQLYSLWTVDGVERWQGLRIYDEIVDHRTRKWETEVVKPLVGERYVTPQEIRGDPGRFILCFSFFDMNHLLDIKPPGGSYIYSSCEPFNEEMEIDFRRLWEWLAFFQIHPCGFTLEKTLKGEMIPVMDKHYHASGHASGIDVQWVIDQVDPDILIPVHTENRQWFTERYENLILVDEGRRYEL
jgi:ribonuclease J